MSEFAKALNLATNNKRYADMAPLTLQDIVSVQSSLQPSICSTEYKLEARFRTTFILPDTADGEELEQAVRLSKLRIVKAIFGEFERPLLEAIHASYNRDHSKCIELIQGVLNEMQNV